MFDKRGTGLSDRVPNDRLPTLEERMDDLRSVMDAAGSQRAAVFGFSEGGNLSATFAATYPKRTTALIMFGTFAKRIWSSDYPWAPKPKDREREYEIIEREWGDMMDLGQYVPSKISDEPFLRRLATYFRRSASPGAAVALLRMNTQIDIRSVLPTIHVPALIIHRTGDRDAHVEEGRWIAKQIPNARFAELSGEDHLPWVGDSDSVRPTSRIVFFPLSFLPILSRQLNMPRDWAIAPGAIFSILIMPWSGRNSLVGADARSKPSAMHSS